MIDRNDMLELTRRLTPERTLMQRVMWTVPLISIF